MTSRLKTSFQLLKYIQHWTYSALVRFFRLKTFVDSKFYYTKFLAATSSSRCDDVTLRVCLFGCLSVTLFFSLF